MRGLPLLLAVLLVPACHGDNRETAAAAGGGAGGGQIVLEVSWTQDVWPILIVHCQICHTTGTGAAQVPDMRMTDAASLYGRWVRILSQCNPNFFRVLPGQSNVSFVFNKISQVTPICGQRMPLVGAPLDEADQLLIQTWIDQGAPQN